MVNAGGQTVHNSFCSNVWLNCLWQSTTFFLFQFFIFFTRTVEFHRSNLWCIDAGNFFLFYWQLSGHTSHTLDLSNWSFKSLQMVEIQLKLGYSIWFLIVICSFLPVSRMAACLYLVSVGSLWLLGWKLLARGGIKSRISGDCLCGQNCMPQMWVNWNVPWSFPCVLLSLRELWLKRKQPF